MNTLYLFLSINLLTYTWVIYFDSSDNMDVERMEMNIVNFSFMELILGKGALEILGHHSFDWVLTVCGRGPVPTVITCR